MMIHEITVKVGKYKTRKRLGRGAGSGHGRTAGRGHKGAGSRSGWKARYAFEGGQMPYFRRLPKRGFTNAGFTTEFWTVNLRDIVAHPSFSKGGEVTAASLARAGLIRDDSRPLKVLGDLGEAKGLKVRLKVSAARITASARKHVEVAGGAVEETGTRRDRVRGVDRAGGDLRPKNLTKKLERGKKKKKPAKAGADVKAEEPAPG